MTSRPVLAFLGFTALALSSCAKDGGGEATVNNVASTGNIHFDGGLSSKERSAFVSAMSYLEEKGGVAAEDQLLNYMHLNAFDPVSVRRWIEERVQYILPEGYDVNNRVQVLQEPYQNYANPGVLPDVILGKGTLASVADDQPHLVMLNIGALIYLSCKKASILCGVPADGLGTINLTSPRSGVLEIGEGLFNVIDGDYPNAQRIFHLTTLIHEARHSDGAGKYAGFLHDKCPSGDFEGQPACDHSYNGPYEIEAMAIRALGNACTDCTVVEKEIVRHLYADVASRRIDDGGTAEWPDEPEGQR